MANPYFNAAYYLQTNPDVLAGGFTLETAEDHYLQYGANEAYYSSNEDIGGALARKPAPWFDIKHYFAENPDLIPGGVTPETAFEHFTTYGMYEGRTPNAEAAPLTAENLGEYAAENEDLQVAFGIEDTDNLTEDQQNALAGHYYQYGYAEDRPGTPGSTYALTEEDDGITGTNGDDVFNADASEDGNPTLNDGDDIDGAEGENGLSIGAGGLESGAAPTLENIQTILNSDIGIIDEDTGVRADKTLDLSNAEGVEAVWSDFSNLEQSGRWGSDGMIGNPAMNAQVNYVGADADTVFGIANVPGQVGRVSTDPGGAGVTGRGTLSVTFAEAGSVLNLALADNAEDSYYAANAGVAQAEYSIDVAEGNSGTLVLSAQVETVTVSGAGDLAIQDRDYSVLSEFDASGMTGNLRLGDEDRTGNDDAPFSLGEAFVIKSGSGDDEFNLSGVITSGEVDAGAGDDVILVDVTGVTDVVAWELTGGEGEDIFVVAGNWGTGEVSVNDLTITIADFNGAEDSLLLAFGGDEEDEDVVLSFGRQDDVDGAIEDAEPVDAAAALDAVLELFNSEDGLLDGNGNKANIAQFEFDGNTYVVYGDNANEDVGVGSITLTGVDLDLSLDNVMAV